MGLKPGARHKNYDEQPRKARSRFREPHSPWQKTIEQRRVQLDFSYRVLAKVAKIPDGTIFTWIHGKRGYPTEASYSEAVNKRLAKALEIDPGDLWADYLDSKRATPRPAPVAKEDPAAYPAPRTPGEASPDTAAKLIEIIEATGLETVSIDTLKRIHKTLI